MRLMKIMQWDQISIINMSDLCSANLTDFKTKLVYANDRSLSYHSIFSKERENELQKLLIHNPDVELIAGWGTDPFIKNMAGNIFQHRLINDIKGWKHKTYPFYYHPNPRIFDNKKEWIVRTLQSIGAKFS